MKKKKLAGRTRKATVSTTIRDDLDALALRVTALEARMPPKLEDGMADAHAEAPPTDDEA
jgi:hypothetical protein